MQLTPFSPSAGGVAARTLASPAAELSGFVPRGSLWGQHVSLCWCVPAAVSALISLLVSLLISSPSSSASSWRTASCECGSVGNAVPRVPALWTLGRLSITVPPSWPLCCLGTGGFCFERGKTQKPKLTLSQVLHIQEGILNNYVSVFSEKGLTA